MTGKRSFIGSFSPIRRWCQIIFLAIVFAIGIQFALFVFQLESGILPDVDRPPGVEAFLPISVLVSLKHLIYTKTINDIHPSGLVIFLIICVTALVVKKGFCSWVCPFGLFSDILAKNHSLLFFRSLKLPQWADIPLRGLKYLLAGFFIYFIFYKMPVAAIEQFIHSPYNRFADIKMLAFFTDISATGPTVIFNLIGLSFLIPYFWCRYLCPYGAILGILGFSLKTSGQTTRKPVPGIIIVAVFVTGIVLARLSGNWHNSIPKEAYLAHVTQPPSMPVAGHPEIDVEKIKKMVQAMKARRAKATITSGETKGE
jgi:polyferredoxin